MQISNQIEAVLFFKGEPVSVKKLSEILRVSIEEIEAGLAELRSVYVGRGFVLVSKDGEYTLGTAPELSDLIDNLQKEELNKNLTKSSLETLSIILYKNGASRAEIDYIRGVNSSFTLRALSVRGLIEKVADPSDARKYLYKPTLELISYMGLTDIKELPNFGEVSNKLDQIKDTEIKDAE